MNDRTQRYRIWLILLVIGGLVAGFVSYSSGDWLRGILLSAVAAVGAALFLASRGSTS